MKGGFPSSSIQPSRRGPPRGRTSSRGNRRLPFSRKEEKFLRSPPEITVHEGVTDHESPQGESERETDVTASSREEQH